MELPQETEDYIRESIDDSVGLPVSTGTLLHKLRAVEASNVHLRHQYLSLISKLREKDEIVERSRAEANMNAVALKKFVEENQKLAAECSNLLAACNKWERECSLYDQDREALMDFANEADERAKEAEIRNHDLEEERKKLVEELHFYKFRSDGQLVDVSADDLHVEQILLDSLLTTLFGKDEITSTAHSFLEAHSGVEVCQKLLNMWTSLRPLTQKVVALAAEVKTLEKDKDHLTVNLRRAEDEVNALFEENTILNEENKRLMRLCYREKHTGGSGKRKSSPKTSSPAEKKIDSSDVNTLRQPLSPLQHNSPETRMHKK
ncbi:hypothetical protein DH2020_035575 [Rehmannia glutinosa]|uniref:Uncharacterized protein n=1 Tax=Rehmannia glutinosa TaxID=99300 RepID=A0ABR0V615_REHGL